AVAYRPGAVTLVGRAVSPVSLADLALLDVDRRPPATRRDVIELVGPVTVRVDLAAALHLELADELEDPALGDVSHLAGLDQPPHRHRAVVLDDRRHLFDRSHVHDRDSIDSAA